MTYAQVRRRRVFYIPGYDPFPPRRYRELYRSEGKAQAALRGYEITLRPRTGERFGWGVNARIGEEVVGTTFEVLDWSYIVRSSMGAGIAATYWQMCRTVFVYVASGALWRLMGLRRGPVIAAFYPVVMLLAQLLAGIGAGVALGWMVGSVLQGAAASAVVAVACCAAVMRWFRKNDGRFFAYYLMHNYGFSARYNGAYSRALETRIAGFADTIAASLAEDVDEVLVVGHSSGAHIAISVLADLIRAGRVPANGPELSFLSLGQVVPMVSFLPGAHRLRADLRLLGSTRALTWVDVSAPGDGGAFALCDPVAVTGVADEPRTGPLILSAAFTRTLRPETWAKLRRRYFRLHFQYLCAFDSLPDSRDAYDYFAVTAGPLTLGQRFKTRGPSRSLIDRATSRYTSIAA